MSILSGAAKGINQDPVLKSKNLEIVFCDNCLECRDKFENEHSHADVIGMIKVFLMQNKKAVEEMRATNQKLIIYISCHFSSTENRWEFNLSMNSSIC